MSSRKIKNRFEGEDMSRKHDSEKSIKKHYALNFSGYNGSKWHIFPSVHPLDDSLCGKKKVRDQSMNTLQKKIGETENGIEESPGIGSYCGSCLKSAKRKQVEISRA